MSNSEVAVPQDKLIELSSKYQLLSENAKRDTTFKSDYEAALLVPSLFLSNVKSQKDFDYYFDKIMHHLNSAYRKADFEDQLIVTCAIDELIHLFIFVMQKRIEAIAESSSVGNLVVSTLNGVRKSGVGSTLRKMAKEFAKETAVDQVTGVAANYVTGGAAEPAILAIKASKALNSLSPKDMDNIANFSSGLLQDFTGFLSARWAKGKDESYFFNQLLHIYRKAIDSDAFFSGGFPNTTSVFERNKEIVLGSALNLHGVDAAIHLIKLDSTDNEICRSAKIIVKGFIDLGQQDVKQWEALIEFLKRSEIEHLANNNELRRDVIAAYNAIYSDKVKGFRYKPDDYKARIELDDEEWEAYLDDKSAKKKKFLIIGLSVSVVIIIGLVIGFFAKQSSYELKAKVEQNRINTTAADIAKLIKQGQFSEASQKINSELKWSERGMFLIIPFFIGDDNRTTEINLNKDVELLNAIRDKLNELCKEQMNDANYRSANEILTLLNSIFERFGENTKSKHETLFKSAHEEVDRTRQVYLEQLLNNINSEIEYGNINSANASLPSLYHYSENEFKSKLLGIFKTSYKEYWEDKKEEIIKKLRGK